MICFIIPEYIDGRGNCCRIKESGEETVFDGGINSALRYIYGKKNMDLRVVRRKCSNMLNQKNLIPLYAGEGNILIPVKVRIPRVMRDGGYGYINANEIGKVQDRCIILKDDTKIYYFESRRVLSRRIRAARIVQEGFEDREVNASTIGRQLAVPATKEDISILLGEMMRLKKTIEKLMYRK